MFLRFDVPAALADKEVAAVSLALQVDDSLAASSRVAGSMHQSPNFDLVALELTAPELGAALAVSEDVPQAGSVVTWELDPSLVGRGRRCSSGSRRRATTGCCTSGATRRRSCGRGCASTICELVRRPAGDRGAAHRQREDWTD